MGVLESTKYRNNIRTISGTGNVVYNNDVEILCDTSSAEVTINLNEIPDNFWSTTYKLYIKDISNNAGTNNITIVAPSGHTIDNLSEVKLTTNGKSCIVRIAGNKTYVTNTASSSSGGCSFIEVTVKELQDLITASSVVECAYYKVTDASNVDLGVIVKGISNTKVSLNGSGLFLNPDFQNVSGNNVGVWNSSLSGLTANVSICIWDNLHYKNLTGAVGTEPSGDAVNWEVMDKSIANTYILEVDYVEYNPISDQILRRIDKRGNDIQWGLNKGIDTLLMFQWGNNNVSYNTCVNVGLIKIINNMSRVTFNFCNSSGIIDAEENLAIINNNNISNSGRLSTSDYAGRTENNHISVMEILLDSTCSSLTSFSSKTASIGYSEFDLILDLSDPTIYDLPSTELTIPSQKNWAGTYSLSNSNKTISKIGGGAGDSKNVTFLTHTAGETTTFTTTTIGSASTRDIVSNQTAGNIIITGRINGEDSIIIREGGNLNIVQGKPNVLL